jgi:hypothetical protein
MVERWIERGYEESADRPGRRPRVTVIERGDDVEREERRGGFFFGEGGFPFRF